MPLRFHSYMRMVQGWTNLVLQSGFVSSAAIDGFDAGYCIMHDSLLDESRLRFRGAIVTPASPGTLTIATIPIVAYNQYHYLNLGSNPEHGGVGKRMRILCTISVLQRVASGGDVEGEITSLSPVTALI